MTFQEASSPTESTPVSRQRRPIVVVVAAVVLGAFVTLVIIWSVGPSSPNVEQSNSLHAGFDFNHMKIIDQDGTVDVNVWVKNVGDVATPGTCSVRSGTGKHFYRGSSAFSLNSL